MAGARELENRYGRSAGAATQPPLCARRCSRRRRRQRFTQRAGDDVDAPITSQYSWEPRPFSPTKPTAWSHRPSPAHRIYPPVANAFQVGDHAIHRNTPSVAISVTRAGLASFFQTRLQLLHIVVGIAEALRFTQTHAVDDRGMVPGRRR